MILFTSEDIHGLDYDLTTGLIDEEEYDEIVQQIIDERLIKMVRDGSG
jgi:hypothetical protein